MCTVDTILAVLQCHRSVPGVTEAALRCLRSLAVHPENKVRPPLSLFSSQLHVLVSAVSRVCLHRRVPLLVVRPLQLESVSLCVRSPSHASTLDPLSRVCAQVLPNCSSLAFLPCWCVCVCVCPGPSVAHRAPSHDGPGGARGSSRGRGGGAALPAGTLGSHTYPSCSTVEWFCTGAAFQTSLGSCPFFRVAIQPLPLVMHCLYSCLVLGRALELEGVLRSALYRAVWVSMCRELLASSRARAPG
jgi:hypothetical protein